MFTCRVRRAVLFSTCAAFFLCSACSGPISLRQQPLTLIWYGLARQGNFQNPTYVPLRDGVTLATNEGIQIFLTVKPSAYLYVLHQTTSGQFAVLWPVEAEGFNAYVEGGRVQTLPSRGRVYTMHLARGTEAIYIIASRKPIPDVDRLHTELRCLFTSAQAIAAGVPGGRIREALPRDLAWKLNQRNPVPIRVGDQHIPVGTTVESIGEVRLSSERFITTAEGGTYAVRPEQLRGRNVVARIVRIRRIVSREP